MLKYIAIAVLISTLAPSLSAEEKKVKERTSIWYDEIDDVVKKTIDTFDQKGRIIRTKLFNDKNVLTSDTEYIFVDSDNQKINITKTVHPYTAISTNYIETYDNNGNMIEKKEWAIGFSHEKWIYNEQKQLIENQKIAKDGKVYKTIKYKYNESNLRVSGKAESENDSYKIKYTYNNQGKIVEERHFDYRDRDHPIPEEKLKITWKYDQAGNNIEKCTFYSGSSFFREKEERKYDYANRLIELKTWGEGEYIHRTYTYGNNGKLNQENVIEPTKITIKYDNEGRKIEVSGRVFGSKGSGKVVITYNFY